MLIVSSIFSSSLCAPVLNVSATINFNWSLNLSSLPVLEVISLPLLSMFLIALYTEDITKLPSPTKLSTNISAKEARGWSVTAAFIASASMAWGDMYDMLMYLPVLPSSDISVNKSDFWLS